VVSELVRPSPAPAVLGWMEVIGPDDVICTASIVISELAFGIERLPQGRKRIQLQDWFDELLRTTFENRVLPFGVAEGLCYGRLAARLKQKQPHALQVQDVQLAAVATCRGLTIVTRNMRDFEGLGVSLLNPWDADGSGNGQA
jgi:predicted nucleic acid-binding protein